MKQGIEGEGKGVGGWESEGDDRGVGRGRGEAEVLGDSELDKAIFTKTVSDTS